MEKGVSGDAELDVSWIPAADWHKHGVQLGSARTVRCQGRKLIVDGYPLRLGWASKRRNNGPVKFATVITPAVLALSGKANTKTSELIIANDAVSVRRQDGKTHL